MSAEDTGSVGSAVQGTAEPQKAAERVHAYLMEFATLRGADPSVVHVANRVPLLTEDLRLLAVQALRVVEDEDTVERVAAKIWAGGALSGWSLDMEHYRVMARAALQALREGSDQ